MRVLGNIAKWLFIFSLPALLISATVNFEFNSLWLYRNGFEKYNVSEATGLDKAELEQVASGLIGYFNSADEYISLTVVKDGEPSELFNQREVVHLKDVKALVQMNRRLMLGTAVYVGVYAGISLFWRGKQHRRRLAWSVFIGSSITLGIIVALGAGSMLLDFDELFTRFHFLAFTNNLWMLDPATDYLIMLFPEGFWYDSAIILGQITAATAGTLCVISRLYWKRAKKQPD
ncbi:MAG: TIGR01906 family membrane protein [Dehalococcoidales bacterium]|nr:TIGR01906 family membrane protein [Dehalococcoidales bacterium]